MKPLRVAVTGSECTGKTTLAAALAGLYGAPWVPEFCRGYQDAKGGPLEAADVEPIARGQIAEADAAAAEARDLLVLDTDLVSTLLYARHYYGSCPAWVERAAVERRGDLYLLCTPDVPWVPDGLRDRGEQRAEMHALFVATLASLGCRVHEVRGSGRAREEEAAGLVGELLLGRSG